MKKSELKTGMIVLTRRGEYATVFKNNVYGQDAIVFNENNWTGLDSFEEDTLEWHPETVRDRNNRTSHQKSVDIIKVFQPDLPTGFFKQDSKFGPMKILWDASNEIRNNLVEGKWYENKLGGVFCYTGGFDSDGDPFGYGFILDKDDEEDTPLWTNDERESESGWSVVKEADMSFVRELMIQELVKRKIEGGASVGYLKGNAERDVQIIRTFDISSDVNFRGNELLLIGAAYNGCGLVAFKDGVWIEVKEPEPIITYEINSIVRVIKGGFGASGANNSVGYITDAPPTSGIDVPGCLKVQIGNRVWGLNNDAQVEIIN